MKAWGLFGFIALCFAAAGIGMWLTTPQLGVWYSQLQKPSWTPPDWVFGPVWTVLYLSMALAGWLVWQRHGWSGARTALRLYVGQLLLNVAWPGLFFALRRPGVALIELVALWLAITATLVAFWRKHRLAAALLVPYLAWVSFAGVLNYAIWQLNR